MSPEEPQRVERVVYHAKFAIELGAGKSGADLAEDRVECLALRQALVFQGRNVGGIGAQTRRQFPDVSWSQLEERAVKLVTEYDSIDYEDIRRCISDDLPDIIGTLSRLGPQSE